jgi:hypothetical protein
MYGSRVVGVASVVLVATWTSFGCSSSSSSGGTATKDGGVGSGTGTGTGTGPGMTKGCSPTSACGSPHDAVACLGLVDNKGLTKFGLRMTELDLTAPAALTTGSVATTVGGGVAPNNAACNENGTGTFTWLLQFDTSAMTLTTGGARPVADPTKGYSFDDEMISQGTSSILVQPAVFSVTPDSTGHFSVATGQDLNVPIFLDATGSSVLVLPLHQAEIQMGTLSNDNNCIGSYNASTLSPTNNCQPSPPQTAFTDGAALRGYISLEQADTVTITLLQQSLCAFLTGNATMYGTSTGSTTVCKRDAGGHIVFQGDWCAATNMAATASCADSVQFAGKFAAASVLINGSVTGSGTGTGTGTGTGSGTGSGSGADGGTDGGGDAGNDVGTGTGSG